MYKMSNKEAFMSVKIIADSTCDLPKELLDKYDIAILPLQIFLVET